MLATGAAGAQDKAGFAALARSAGTPQVPGLHIVYLSPLGDPAAAKWRNIIVHQTEGPPGSARAMAALQAKNPARRGVMRWVETDGTVYWATPETAVTTHGDGANRNDNKYIDNSKTIDRLRGRTRSAWNSSATILMSESRRPSSRPRPGWCWCASFRNAMEFRSSASMRTTGSITRITVIARAAIWRSARARKDICRAGAHP
jgi:hypothetical protein